MFIMGLFDSFASKEPGKPKDICIPEHVLRKQGILTADEKAEEAEQAKAGNLFEIEGIYEPRDTFLITGRVISGCIKKGAKCKSTNAEFSAAELTIGKSPAESVKEGGTAVIKLKYKKHPFLRVGDTLEFK